MDIASLLTEYEKHVVWIDASEETRLLVHQNLRSFMIFLETRQDRDENLMRQELDELRCLLNTPEIENFDKAVPLEAAHQVARWGADHDAGKKPSDWFWLLGYLAGKALNAHENGDSVKAQHHCISSAAVLRNWHAHIRTGQTKMRPGISEEKTVGA